ncbi:MAG: DUF1080 domain-containing protein [Acidobacteria bacterium]|nr:DUF1080 domain-containing protein [Acidobacteriota bacterium]
MSVRVLLLSLALGYQTAAQQSASGPEDEIRHTVERYMDAVRRQDRALAEVVSAPGRRRVSPGGTAQFNLREGLPSWTLRSNMIRRVEMLSPNTAVAIGIWRDFQAKPPFDVGTFHYTLLRETGSWKVSFVHESFLPAPRTVSSLAPPEARDGTPGVDSWEPLFDGRTLSGWFGTEVGQELSRSWRVEDACLVARADGQRSSLVTERQFLFFDLRFEWSAASKTNSGVKYRLLGFDRILNGSREALGFEYQVADDDGDVGARHDPRQRSGALYSVTAVEPSVAKPLGQWNESRIVVTADRVEHWLNGNITASHATDIPFASSIALQHHTTEVRFRNLRIRRLRDGGF